METEAIFIYCLADAIVRAHGLKDEPRAKMTNAEIITFVMISALFYQCNYKLTRLVSLNCKLFSSPLSQSRMNRRIHSIPQAIWVMIVSICRGFHSSSREFIVDSFPVARIISDFVASFSQGDNFMDIQLQRNNIFGGLKFT